jgi:hypothetical protein
MGRIYEALRRFVCCNSTLLDYKTRGERLGSLIVRGIDGHKWETLEEEYNGIVDVAGVPLIDPQRRHKGPVRCALSVDEVLRQYAVVGRAAR